MNDEELSRKRRLENSSCLRVILQKTDKCQNCLEIASNAKKWKKYKILPVQETYLKQNVFYFLRTSL
jgi:hypothetical protein